MRRLVPLLVALALVAPAAAAAQGGAFDPLPPAPQAETPTPTPPPSVEAQQDTDRRLLLGIAAGLLVLFVLIARFITRDARRSLPADGRRQAAPVVPEAARHRQDRQAKAKARAKGKAQRAARRQNR